MRDVANADDPEGMVRYLDSFRGVADTRPPGKQLEIDAAISMLMAHLMDVDDLLNRSDASELDPERAFHSGKELSDAILLAVQVWRKYASKSATARRLARA